MRRERELSLNRDFTDGGPYARDYREAMKN